MRAYLMFGSMALGSMALAVAGPAHAQGTSAAIPVSLSVEQSCRVQASPLAFSGTSGTILAAQSEVAVGCTADTGVSVALDDGRNAVGATRRLADETGGFVPYAIFVDSAGTRAWGAGEAAVTGTVAGGADLRLTAYGRVATDRLPAAGTYRDTVTVTVSF